MGTTDRRAAFLKKLFRMPAWLAVTVGVVVGLAVFLEVRKMIRAETFSLDRPRYLVAVRDLKPGLPVSFRDFTISFIADTSLEIPFHDQEWAELKEARLVKELKKGTALYPSSVRFEKPLGLADLKKGEVAYTVRPANRVPAGSGDRIDVFYTPHGQNDEPMALLDGVRVLQALSGEARELLLAIPPSAIPLLEKAGQRGKLTIALRQPHDPPAKENVARRTPRSWGRTPTRVPVEILIEGE